MGLYKIRMCFMIPIINQVKQILYREDEMLNDNINFSLCKK